MYCEVGRVCSFGEDSSFSAHCSFGIRCGFGDHCNFGDECNFGEICTFCGECSFGERCIFNGKRALPGHPLLAFIGTEGVNRTVYAFNVEGGPWLETEFFSGDLDAFRAKVRADSDKLKALQYLGFASIVAATWCHEKVEL
jgi:hypothetical protein